MTRSVLFAAVFLVSSSLHADEKPALTDGNWLLVAHVNASSEQRLALISIEIKDDKLMATAKAPRGEATISDLKADGKAVSFSASVGVEARFEGKVDPKDPKRFLGSLDVNGRLFFASLTATEKKALEQNDAFGRPVLPEPMQEVVRLRNTPFTLQSKLRKAKDPDDKEKLQKELKAAREEAEEKTPGLLKEVMAKHADSQSGYDAANDLIRQATKWKVTPKDAEEWAGAAVKFAEPYGPKMQAETASRLAESLVTQEGYATIALKYAEQAASTAGDSLNAQARALKTLRSAQEKTGKGDAAKETAAKLARVEEKLDAEYSAKVPPFKVEKYAGRKAGGNRVAVLELFTGAQCPPCVAADVAFDGLLKAYTPKDLILIQYHIHVPGPDPLTNPDTQARWNAYREAFPEGVRGVPTSVFNGKPEGGGGGGMAASETKFKQYREIIDPLLEQSTDVTVTAKAALKGDSLEIEAAVAGVKEDALENLKLRLLVCEESIRYLGGNGIRFHHQVVRSMPGGVEGVAIKNLANAKHSARVDLADLRKSLGKYLDDFVAENGPFSNPDRPLDLKDLRVIALVQDGKTHEIIQATQVEVPGGK